MHNLTIQNLPTTYEHDVFISYKRSFLIESWVTKFFLKFFQEWLREKLLELGEPQPRIFFDQSNIEPGDPWPQRLRRALQTSKILLPICSPSYFNSVWCLSEWQSFLERQRLLGTDRLVIPVRHNDSERFIGNIAWSDFYDFTFLASDFYQTAQAISFEKKIQELASVVARAIRDAPPFQPDWPLYDAHPDAPEDPVMLRL